mgnify:CR=1 FL=1
MGKGQAIVSSTDLKDSTLQDLIDRAITKARNAPADPYCEIPSTDSSRITQTDLELYDPREISPEDLFDLAAENEDADPDGGGIGVWGQEKKGGGGNISRGK